MFQIETIKIHVWLTYRSWWLMTETQRAMCLGLFPTNRNKTSTSFDASIGSSTSVETQDPLVLTLTRRSAYSTVNGIFLVSCGPRPSPLDLAAQPPESRNSGRWPMAVHHSAPRRCDSKEGPWPWRWTGSGCRSFRRAVDYFWEGNALGIEAVPVRQLSLAILCLIILWTLMVIKKV